jgi:2-amino-4-hydroxy-6-hydroxymethyldihydropteridine diphosphokinase
MAEVAIGLGSNLGDREAHLREAAIRLSETGRVVAMSSLYQTAPVGFADQDDFLNACILLETGLTPEALLKRAHAIEKDLARVRTIRNGPRTIDVDLLLWRDQGDSLARSQGKPKLPHPRMHRRRFVLEPLAEIAADWRHPLLQRSIAQLLAALPDGEAVERFSSPTWPPSLEL